jgi:hypothetical protein
MMFLTALMQRDRLFDIVRWLRERVAPAGE